MDHVKTIPLRDWGWIGINGLMGLLFLWLSSGQWIEPELKDVPGASGGAPLVFTMLVVQLLLPLMIVNLAWLAIRLWRGKPAGDRLASVWLFGVMTAAWVGLVLFSASRV